LTTGLQQVRLDTALREADNPAIWRSFDVLRTRTRTRHPMWLTAAADSSEEPILE